MSKASHNPGHAWTKSDVNENKMHVILVLCWTKPTPQRAHDNQHARTHTRHHVLYSILSNQSACRSRHAIHTLMYTHTYTHTHTHIQHLPHTQNPGESTLDSHTLKCSTYSTSLSVLIEQTMLSSRDQTLASKNILDTCRAFVHTCVPSTHRDLWLIHQLVSTHSFGGGLPGGLGGGGMVGKVFTPRGRSRAATTPVATSHPSTRPR